MTAPDALVAYLAALRDPAVPLADALELGRQAGVVPARQT